MIKYILQFFTLLTPLYSLSNHVSSEFNVESSQYIAPFKVISTPEHSISLLKEIVLTNKNARILKETPLSLTCEYTSSFFKFKDIVTFSYDSDRNVIECSSRSLTGYYDFNVNRERLEKIRSLYTQKKPAT